MKKVFIVDDDKVFLSKIVSCLVKNKYEVSSSSNYIQSESMVRKKYDVYIVDLMLPPYYTTEGLNLIQEIFRYNENAIVFLITIKESGTTEIVARAMRLGSKYAFDKKSPDFFDSLMSKIDEEIEMVNEKNIFVSHGHNELLRLKLIGFLQNKLKLNPITLLDEPSHGRTIIEKLELVSNSCHMAIILITKDDEEASGAHRGRQNVVHELGFFQGKYGREKVVLLAEKGVQLFSNISGIVRIDFDKDYFDGVFELLRLEMGTYKNIPE